MIVFCAACGTQNDGSSKFCSGCGGALTARPSAPPMATPPPPAPTADASESPREAPVVIGPAVNRCPACGQTAPATQRFCHFDGAPLAAAPPEPVGAAAVALSITTPPPLPPAQALPTPPDLAASFETQQPPEAPIPVAQVAASPAPMESPSVIDPAIPAPAISAPSTVADRTSDPMQHCPACGIVFPAGVRFCDQDGTLLISGGADAVEAAAERGDAPWLLPYPARSSEGETDDDYPDDDRSSNRRGFVPAVVAAVLLVLFAGGGYAFWSGAFDRWLGRNETSTKLGDTSDLIAENQRVAASLPKTPGLLGRYSAHLADQDIVLAIEQNTPTSALRSFTATLTYSNAVNGGTCTASLTATGDREGSTPGFAVSFRQGPVPGQPSCPAELPVTLDITGQPTDANGVVASISAEWRKPDSDDVLMKGILLREAGQ